MKVKAIISALMLMACGMASAQTKTYLNVETAPGVYKSFEVNKDLKISWGEKKEVPPTKGTAKRTGDVDVKWVQLWENGPKFAEYNVGATSATEYGGYFTWGGNSANGEGVWNDYYNNGESNLSCTGDNITDTATKLWGSNWRMPTKAELQALLANCEVEWTIVDGLQGRKFTGKDTYSSNSIFLPAAGHCNGGNVLGQDYDGFYWSSAPYGIDRAYELYINSDDQYVDNYGRKENGCSVRAVFAE